MGEQKRQAIRVGFIGAGGICRSRHLPGLSRIDGVQVMAVANRTRESAQAVAHEFHIPDVETDWRRLIARRDLDAIFIGTWPYMHMEMACAALETGKHVFCQARMSSDLAQAKRMLEAARAHPKQVNMICPPPTRMPFEPYITEVLRSGQLGPITLVELTSVSGTNLDPTRISWREQVEYSGRQVLGMGIMAETLNAWVGEYEELSARTITPIPTKRDSDGRSVSIGIPQAVTITGRLKCGALAIEHHTGLAADKSSSGNRLTIWGLRGTLRYGFGPTIEQAAAGEELKPVDVPADLRRPWLVEEDFIAAVSAAQRGQSWSVSPDFAEGLSYMRKVEAVHLAAETRRAVRPDEL